ncbi:DNA replication accessory factor [Phascolarctid gammaherpesvirus 1]|uniref:DNA replication accessory factor n=1 Tax=Phascolarctid gammaherpesvirus 1 TaxID=2249313 RepID=A0A3S8D7K3_9GAMA|nr:DNA replication accessory factor [Phascolarctid gammaherpesvirus 1]AZB49230.1 DNA replication accessory factor [Phascolarctid gammaherpesvirus 1]
MVLCVAVSLDAKRFRARDRILQHLKDICYGHWCIYVRSPVASGSEFGFYIPLEANDHIICCMDRVVMESYWPHELAGPITAITEISPWDYSTILHHASLQEIDIYVKRDPGGRPPDFEVVTAIGYTESHTKAKYTIPASCLLHLESKILAADFPEPSATMALSVKSQNELIRVSRDFLERGNTTVRISISGFLSILNVSAGSLSFSLDYKMRPGTTPGKRKRPQDEAEVTEDCECVVSVSSLLRALKACKIPNLSNSCFVIHHKKCLIVQGVDRPEENSIYAVLYHTGVQTDQSLTATPRPPEETNIDGAGPSSPSAAAEEIAISTETDDQSDVVQPNLDNIEPISTTPSPLI